MDSVSAVDSAAPIRATGKGPILLFGMPRSGTTWLGKLFDSHPDTLYRHEPDTWRRLDIPRYPSPADSAEYERELQRFMEEMPDFSALRVAGKLPLFPKAYLSRPRQALMNASVHLAQAGSRVYSGFPVLLHQSGEGYPQRRTVWKSIASLGRTGVVLDALPAATGIHILRHPCGYIASVMRGLRGKKFSDNTSTSEDYGIFKAAVGTPLGDAYGLSMDGLAAMKPVQRLAWQWVLINEKALIEGGPSGRMLCMRYEDVCREPLARVEQMFAFTGLTMPEQTRAFVEASTTHTKNGYYSVFKDPLASAMRWQEELDPEITASIMAIVQRSRFADQYGEQANSTVTSS